MSATAKLRLVAINDVYELMNLPKLQSFLMKLTPKPDAVLLAGDFVSPSTLSSIDGGYGMISTLRAVGITHGCFGNHEADIKLPKLKGLIQELSKTATIINSNMRILPSSHSLATSNKKDNNTDVQEVKEHPGQWLTSSLTPPYSIIQTSCGRVNIALLGLMSDEEHMFRDGTFKGMPISNVLTTFTNSYNQLVQQQKIADFCIPLTHQSIGRDRELAKHMLQMNIGSGVIIGGHEHEPIDTIMHSNGVEINGEFSPSKQHTEEDGVDSIHISKSGSDAEYAGLIDVIFGLSSSSSLVPISRSSMGRVQSIRIEKSLIDLRNYNPSPVVQQIVDQSMSIIHKMEEEAVVDVKSFLSHKKDREKFVLSSERTRFQQTTVGGIFCKAIKEEMEVDVALINGASIKGGNTYKDGTISYAQLKKELPFPTKMVIIQMKKSELINSIHYSRTQFEEGTSSEQETNEIARRGYLQVDSDFDSTLNASSTNTSVQHDNDNKDDDKLLFVALPRNLLSGFCKIQPLIDVGNNLKKEKQFPSSDEFVPAIDLVIRYFSKNRWIQLVDGDVKFEDFDINNDGVIDREEIKLVMKKLLGKEPANFVIDDMISALDEDGDGVVAPNEFSYLLAMIERQRSGNLFSK